MAHFQLRLTCPDLKEYSHGGWWSDRGSTAMNEVATVRSGASWKMTGDGIDRPRDGQLGAPPSKVELERGRSCDKTIGSASNYELAVRFRIWFRVIPAPLDAVLGRKQSGRRLSRSGCIRRSVGWSE